MNMSNDEKDEFIRQSFSNDKYMTSGEEVIKKVIKDFDASKIKVNKRTFGERRFFRFLSLVVVISLGSTVYLAMGKYGNSATLHEDNKETRVAVSFGDEIEDNFTTNEVEQEDNTYLKKENNNSKANITSKIVDVEDTDNKEIQFNEEDIKKELERYSISIGRFVEDSDELEKNTILLLMANDFFNSKGTENSSLNLSSNGKYAMTADNVHLYLKELTGIEIEGFLDSYVNYMKYNEKSKFYSSGPNSTDLKNEKYNISNLEVVQEDDNEYIVKGDLERKSIAQFQDKRNVWTEEIEANYDIEARIEFNTNCTYTPYLIKEFNAILKQDEEDNIDRLVDIQSQIENNKNK